MDLIRRYSPTFLVIMETHVEFEKTRNFWLRAGYNKVAIEEARGQSGGLWILQHRASNVGTMVVESHPNAITLKLVVGSASWHFTGVYASPTYSHRLDFWRYLTDLRDRIVGPWVMMGDFNEIIHPSEVRGGSFNNHRAQALLNVLDSCYMTDMPSTGSVFTWRRNCTGYQRVSKKLDRSTADIMWRHHFPEAFVEVLCRFHSDHNPLLLRCGGLPQSHGTRPFRFEAAWITHPQYQEVVRQAWSRSDACPVLGLKHVTDDSVVFNKEIFGNIWKRKRELERRLKGVQRTLERVDSAILINLERQLQMDYDNILNQEEILWYQKSREKWITLGDRNTKFFHAQTVIRRKRNKIHGLNLPDGNWCTDDSILQHEAQLYFQRLFCNPTNVESEGSSLPTVNVPKLSAEAIHALTLNVSKEEVYAALQHMHPYKSPGPDGFQGIFFRQYWHIIGDDVTRLVCQAFTTGYFDPIIASTLIALIPKVDNPRSFKEFRPISLCNTLYKLITKVLVQRMRPYLSQIIGPYQSSFLPGRGTSDNAIVLQEVLHSMHTSKKKKGDVAYKIDLEKAYDHVNWNFLKLCLEDFGFPSITVALIMHCVTASTLSLIWNGRRLPSFSPTRGLRQGDPLSPYLFVLCMEKLSHSILSAVDDGRWKPMRLSRNGPVLSHLFFADDVLLFSKATVSQANLVANIFASFARDSGLAVNVAKSRALFSKSVHRTKQARIAAATGIQSTTSFNKYLGFPMLQGRVKKTDFNFIIEKIHTRLASWKNKLLNKAGRITLAKSVMNSIPVYYMQTAWLPQYTCDQIDRLTRDFIWKGTTGHGIHLVGWDKITRERSVGGLSIRIARKANTAMLGKLVWDLHTGPLKLWVNLVREKYMGNAPILDMKKKNGSYTWNSIMKARDMLKDGFLFRVGNGLSSLWYSDWLGIGPLAKEVPFIDIHDSELCISDVYFDRSWHLEMLYSFLPMNIIDHIRTIHFDINSAVEDSYIWKWNLDGVYTANAGYKWLLSQSSPVHHPNVDQSWNWIWGISGPEKIKLLIWMACHEALPTAALLSHRGMMNSPACQRCGHSEESVMHCLRDCPKVSTIWLDLGFRFPNFFTSVSAFVWLKEATKCHLFLASLWWIWRARNIECIAKEIVPNYVLKLSIHNMASRILKSCEPSVNTSKPSRLVSWKPPIEYEVVLNVDGSSFGNPGISGFGGLLRGQDGHWIAGFIGHIGISNNLHAELLGLKHGLMLAWDKGFRSLVCYSDSLNVIQLINSPLNDWNRYAPIIHAIKDLLERDWLVLLAHTHREGNACADFLAKLGAGGRDYWTVLDVPPAGLTPHLLADAVGVEFVRV